MTLSPQFSTVISLTLVQVLYLVMNLLDLTAIKGLTLDFQSGFATILSVTNSLLVLGSGFVLAADTFYARHKSYFNEGSGLSLISGGLCFSLGLLSLPFYPGSQMKILAFLSFLNIPLFLHYFFLRQYSLLEAKLPSRIILIFLTGTLLKFSLNIFLQKSFPIFCFPLATLSAFSIIIALIHFQLRKSNPELTLKPSLNEVKNLLKVGIPLGFQLMLRSLIFTLITIYLNFKRPELAVAFSLVSLLASILYTFPYGAGMLLSVGIHERARQNKLSTSFIKTILFRALSYGLLISILIYFDADIFSQWFHSTSVTPHVLRLGLQGYALFQVFDTVFTFLSAIYRGLLLTQPIFQSFLSGMLFLGLPSVYYLVEILNLGISGIWIGLSLGIALSTLILFLTKEMEIPL